MVFLVGTIFLVFFFPPYWAYSLPENQNPLHQGTTKEGHPWIGAENPELTIEEFTDYQCFQCKKMHFFLRRLVAQNPEKIRLVHRNYPLDHKFNPILVQQPFHVGSGELALLANAADLKGKFWEMNDLLFNSVHRTDTFKIKDLAEQVGINPIDLANGIADPLVHFRLKQDIWEGGKALITGTPAYRINGEIYTGKIPPNVLASVLN